MQTYIVARNAGDQTFLRWIRDRLVLVKGDNPNVDFIRTLEDFGEYFNRRAEVPFWLNWVLRKYNL